MRLCKILIAFKGIHNDFRGWGSMRPTKCNQDQGNRILRLGVRAQIELPSFLAQSQTPIFVVKAFRFGLVYGPPSI